MLKHARCEFLSQVDLPESPAEALGYRLPAEWEMQHAVWLTLPHNEATWPGCLKEARQEAEHFISQLAANVIVHTTQQVGIETNDSWIRDYGPLFVVHDPKAQASRALRVRARKESKGEEGHELPVPDPTLKVPPVAMHDFIFNNWGGKYGDYELDDVVPQHLARQLLLPLWVHDVVLEGGSIDVNGKGTLLTTSQCLLNLNRNPHYSKQRLEELFHDAFGITHTIWLEGGIGGDDTDGHVDDIARFVGAHRVVAVRNKPGDRDHEVLERNWNILKSATDELGQPLEVIALPMPSTVRYTYPSGRDYDVARDGLPASYANFLISNGAVFVPTFNQPSDDEALTILSEVMPEYEIVGIPARHLLVGLGGLHCLTMQQPAMPVDRLPLSGSIV